ARRGWTFAAFDFRGHGQSSGSLLDLRGTGLQRDLEAIRSYLLTRGVQRLFLVGSSMGAWAGAWFAKRCPAIGPAFVGLAPSFDFLVARWSRLSNAQREIWQHTRRLRLHNAFIDAEIGYGLMEEDELFRVEDLIADWEPPLLIYHGMRDDLVPYMES